MSFLPAVHREINRRASTDPVRQTLEFLLANAVGRNHPVTLPVIVDHLQQLGTRITSTGFQHTVLSESRDGEFYIGSGRRGYFLIDTLQDAEEMRDFYETRIRAEQQHLANLRRQASQVGWSI